VRARARVYFNVSLISNTHLALLFIKQKQLKKVEALTGQMSSFIIRV